MNKYRLRFSKPVILTGDWDYGHPELRAAQHRAIKARRQAIRRELKRMPTLNKRTKLEAELELLSDMETQLFGVQHRATNLPLDKRGRPYVPKTARGKRHVPLAALPLNRHGRPYVPCVKQIVEDAIFKKFAEKNNIAMA